MYRMKRHLIKILVLTFLIISISYLTVVFSLLLTTYVAIKNGRWDILPVSTHMVSVLTKQSKYLGKIGMPLYTVYQSNKAIQDTTALAQTSQELFQSIYNLNSIPFDESYDKFVASYTNLVSDIRFLEAQSWLNSLLSQSDDISFVWNFYKQHKAHIEQAISMLPQLLGSEGEKSYTVLLQNNTEIRPTGGFLGSYVTFTFDKGKLIKHQVSDIYVPDGAIVGHIQAPAALQSAFGHGTWKLRDCNWDPDFPKAARTIDWFLERGGAGTRDGIIAVNVEVVEEIINYLGGITLPDYNLQLTKENLYQSAQHHAEVNFFPGSTAKKDFLQQATNQLVGKVKNLSHTQIAALFEIVSRQFIHKNIQLFFKDQQMQNIMRSLSWDGAIVWKQTEKGVQDYLYISEANLGANKANCCISRDAKRKVTFVPGNTIVTQAIKFTNHNKTDRPQPPEIWGGDYRNYIRVHLPKNAQEVTFAIDSQPVPESAIEQIQLSDSDVQSFGLFIEIPHSSSRLLSFSYKLQAASESEYVLTFQKQSGVNAYNLEVEMQNSHGIQKTIKQLDQDQIMYF